jgi:MFS family permease
VSARPTADRIEPGAWAGIVIALSCGLVSAVGFALNAPLFALTMDDRGVTESAVGLLMTVAGVAALACTPAVPWLMARLPVKAILGGALVATSLMFLLYLVDTSVWAWTAIRFGFAASLTLLFVTSEAWFLELAPEKWRGRLLALYAAIFAGGFGVGGLIIAQLGHEGAAAPLAGAVFSLLALPMLALKAPAATRPEGDAARPSALLRRLAVAPALFVPALAMGAIETGAFNLFPLWVRRVGFEDESAGLLIAACALGNVVLQGPIGVLADKFGRDRTLAGVAVIGILGPLALMAVQTPAQAYGVAFVWSGCVTGFYTLGLMGLAERFPTRELAGANAAYAASYGMGQMCAPLAGGALLQGLGPAGFLAGLSLMALAPLAALLAQRRPAPSA